MDGMIREVDARMMGKGLCLDVKESREGYLIQLLFPDDTPLVADSERLGMLV